MSDIVMGFWANGDEAFSVIGETALAIWVKGEEVSGEELRGANGEELLGAKGVELLGATGGTAILGKAGIVARGEAPRSLTSGDATLGSVGNGGVPVFSGNFSVIGLPRRVVPRDPDDILDICEPADAGLDLIEGA